MNEEEMIKGLIWVLMNHQKSMKFFGDDRLYVDKKDKNSLHMFIDFYNKEVDRLKEKENSNEQDIIFFQFSLDNMKEELDGKDSREIRNTLQTIQKNTKLIKKSTKSLNKITDVYKILYVYDSNYLYSLTTNYFQIYIEVLRDCLGGKFNQFINENFSKEARSIIQL